MAYQNLDTVTWGSSPNITVVFDYDYRRSGSDMQYKVRTTVKTLPTSISTFGYPIYVTIRLDGTAMVSGHQIKAASQSTWSSAIVYETDWMNVSNKTSGNTKLSINLYSGSGESRDKTYSYDLAVSPAASIPTAEASSVELGGSVKIYTNRRDNTFYHRIGCKFGSYSHWGKDIFDDDIAQAWFLFSPPVSLASEIPNATSGTCTIYLTTYSDAACTRQVGDTQSMTLTLTVPASVKPAVSAALSDEAGYLGTFNDYVQGKSRLKLNATASQAYGSQIKSYTFIVDGKTTASTSNEVTVDLLSAGTISVIVRVTDGRGRVSTDYTTTITVLPYAAPQITAMTASRCKKDGTPDPTGTYVNVVFSGAISVLNNINTAVWKVGRKKPTDEYWTETTVTVSQKYAPNSVPTIISGIAVNSPYIFRISATDTVTGTVTSVEIPVPAGYAFLRTNANLDGLSFGKEEVKPNTLGVAWSMEVDGEFSAKGGSIELNRGGTLANFGGYIDFHFNKSANDYTSRIIEDGSGHLSFLSPNGVSMNGGLSVGGASTVAGKLSANGGLTVTGGITCGELPIFPFRVYRCTRDSVTQAAVDDYWSLKCPAVNGYTRIVVDIHTGEPASIVVKNYDFNGDTLRVHLRNTSGASKTFSINAFVLIIPDEIIEVKPYS